MPVTRGDKRLHDYFIPTENSGMKIAMLQSLCTIYK